MTNPARTLLYSKLEPKRERAFRLVLGFALLGSACAVEAGGEAGPSDPSADGTSVSAVPAPIDVGRAALVDPDSAPGRLIVNGAFASPDGALRFDDGAIVVVSVGPNGAGALHESLPPGVDSKLAAVDGLPAQSAFQALAPDLDMETLLDRARNKVFPASEPPLRDDVREWLTASGKLESYLRAEQAQATETPRDPGELLGPGELISLRANECAGWSWFKNDFWNNGPYSYSAKCSSGYMHDHDQYDNCKFATMNNRGPNLVTYVHKGYSATAVTVWSSTYAGELESRHATATTFTDLNGWSVLVASCTHVGDPETSTQVNGLSRRWD